MRLMVRRIFRLVIDIQDKIRRRLASRSIGYEPPPMLMAGRPTL